MESKEFPNLDELTPEEVTKFKEDAYNRSLAQEHLQAGEAFIAMGDSWFNLKVSPDLVDVLREYHGCRIEPFAEPGATLEDMLFGVALDGQYSRPQPVFNRVLMRLKLKRPLVLLFSGGGNDVVGTGLAAFLSHKSCTTNGLGVIRSQVVEQIIGSSFRNYYVYLIEEVKKVSPETVVVTHGYGYAQPTGIPAFQIPYLLRVGPWIKPTLVSKGIVNLTEQEGVVKTLVDTFNEMLLDLARDRRLKANFRYVDLREVINASDWRDEIHLKHSAYKKVGDVIHSQGILGQQ